MKVLTTSDLRCPVSGKHAYPTEESATAELEAAWTRPQHSVAVEKMPRRVYLCECGWWHLSAHWSRS